MTVETVKATYDPSTKTVSVRLSDKKIEYTLRVEKVETLYDYDIDMNIVGIEVVLS